jgi:hypothetical protein
VNLIACDKETSIQRRTRLNVGCSAIGKNCIYTAISGGNINIP